MSAVRVDNKADMVDEKKKGNIAPTLQALSRRDEPFISRSFQWSGLFDTGMIAGFPPGVPGEVVPGVRVPPCTYPVLPVNRTHEVQATIAIISYPDHLLPSRESLYKQNTSVWERYQHSVNMDWTVAGSANERSCMGGQ